MRITGGSARGILLSVPQGIKFLRPATDFLREAIFSSLEKQVNQALVLDLFAGVGTYGMEALSRGANSCVFVEKNRLAVESMESNIKSVKKSARRDFSTKIFCQDVFSWQETCDAKFDLIFVDPPYNMVESQGRELLEISSKMLSDSPDARIIIEVPGSHKIDAIEDVVEIKRLGRTSNSRQPNALIYGKK